MAIERIAGRLKVNTFTFNVSDCGELSISEKDAHRLDALGRDERAQIFEQVEDFTNCHHKEIYRSAIRRGSIVFASVVNDTQGAEKTQAESAQG